MPTHRLACAADPPSREVWACYSWYHGCKDVHRRRVEALSCEKRIDVVVRDSLYTATSYLALSQMETLLDAQQRLARAWATSAQGKRARVGGLISESTSLPWSDQPAQVLYWHLMEALKFHELQTLLYSASHPGGAIVTADNSLLAAL